MTKFEDRLFGQLMTEHGHHLRAPEQTAPAHHRSRRPLLLATGAVGVVAGATAAAVALSSTPAAPGGTPSLAAYSVTQRDGAITVSVDRPSGVSGANATLRAMGAHVVVVPVRAGCPPIGSLPRPQPFPLIAVWSVNGVNPQGHRTIWVRMKGHIPAGDTMILAFTVSRGHSLSEGGIITGPVPHCVSLPPAGG